MWLNRSNLVKELLDAAVTEADQSEAGLKPPWGNCIAGWRWLQPQTSRSARPSPKHHNITSKMRCTAHCATAPLNSLDDAYEPQATPSLITLAVRLGFVLSILVHLSPPFQGRQAGRLAHARALPLLCGVHEGLFCLCRFRCHFSRHCGAPFGSVSLGFSSSSLLSFGPHSCPPLPRQEGTQARQARRGESNRRRDWVQATFDLRSHYVLC